MKDLRFYDSAVQRYNSHINAISAPLSSWDISGMYFQTYKEHLKDLASIGQIGNKNRWQSVLTGDDWPLIKKLVVVITDPHLKIEFASNNIKQMTGYDPIEVVGKSPKLFQGKDTCKLTRERIAEAIENQQPFEETIINYKKNGSPYSCQIKGKPIFNMKGDLVNFIAFEKAVA
ncbi:MAG: histidine kinase [Pseudozobellia sp.]|nr:histidine kinase [Pseudozobellia sp.]MBG49297.1 histidine kinase [Pseudozobellia sp.]|tara:strand:- start:1331171 stop:1331692 length:522 start_codon:yes stop_codon:yes gene_type:complete